MFNTGINKAWDALAERVLEDIADSADVSYSEKLRSLVVTVLALRFAVNIPERTVRGLDERSATVLAESTYFVELSILWYLAYARDIAETGRLVRPEDTKDGSTFFTQGTHRLPLDELARLYDNDSDGFLTAASSLGAVNASFGDVAVVLRPLPRIPVTVILWHSDDEFPARADLLFDSSCQFHVRQVDVLWAAAMLTLSLLMPQRDISL